MAMLLPIEAERRNIVKTIYRRGRHISDRVTIILGDTGVGKSTKIPEYILQDTDHSLIMTQPTQLTAMTIPARIAQAIGCELGEEVGFEHAGERKVSDKTRCLVRTDGLEFIERARMTFGRTRSRKKKPFDTLFIDETHLFNLNIEFLLALAEEEPDLRIVVASATMDPEDISTHFGGAEIIEVQGKMFEIEDREPGESLEEDVYYYVKQGLNVLIIDRGEYQIYDNIRRLEGLFLERGVHVELLPLHASLSPAEQAKCLQKYEFRKVIVASNYVETGYTDPDLDVVIDLEQFNQEEEHDGVRGLYARWTSLASRRQRRGRVGRTKKGIYVGTCPLPLAERKQTETPEIYRVGIEQHHLRLMAGGRSLSSLRLFHPPKPEAIARSEKLLADHRCIDGPGMVTDRGHKVAALPLEVAHACLVVAAHEHGVLDDGVKAASILEQGGITFRGIAQGVPAEKAAFAVDPESDLLTELAAFECCQARGGKNVSEVGVSWQAYRRTCDRIEHVWRAVDRFPEMKRGTSGSKEAFLRAVVQSMIDGIFVYDGSGFRLGDVKRSIHRTSTVKPKPGECYAGVGFDKGILSQGRLDVTRSLTFVTAINPQWLMDEAPHLTEYDDTADAEYDFSRDKVIKTTKLWFRGHLLREETFDASETADAPRLFATWLAKQFLKGIPVEPPRRGGGRSRGQRLEPPPRPKNPLEAAIAASAELIWRSRRLNLLAGKALFPEWQLLELTEFLTSQLKGAVRLGAIPGVEALKLPPLDVEAVRKVETENPRTIEIAGRSNVQVVYDPKNGPVVQVSDWWPLLPDEGHRLPSGRLVAFEIFGWLGPDTDVRKLKEQAAIAFPVRFPQGGKTTTEHGST